ncbi:MAG: hypothetical protein AAGF93_00165 [Cyanobacteria bacterium P01_H01_bin.105]
MIFQTLEKFEKYHRREVNYRARTEAIGWAGLFNGFKGEDTEPVDPANLIPFPERSEEEENKRVLTVKTAKLLAKIIDERRMPPRIQHYVQHLEEVSKWRSKK